jgi:lysophospholipase L1-like esterase
MLECLIIGDSIAVGTLKARTECIGYVQGGLNSYQWVNKFIGKSPYIANTVIISLGSNDHKYVKTESELQTIRQLTKADRVYWILPANKKDIADIVYKVANQYHDRVVRIAEVSKDGVHPTGKGYKMIAEQTK